MKSQYPLHYFQFGIISSRAAEMAVKFPGANVWAITYLKEGKYIRNYLQTPMKMSWNGYSGLYNSDVAFL